MKSANDDSPGRFLPRMLFLLNFALAAALTLLVFLSPLLGGVHSQLLDLFAHDATVRRTALAGAIGLAVTALVFFRSSGASPTTPKTPRPPPSNVVGA